MGSPGFIDLGNSTESARELLRALPEASLWEWLLWLGRRRLRLQVTGDSMEPTLKAGDLVLVDLRSSPTDLLRPGEVVVAWHPYQKHLQIIKRVEAITAEGRVVLRSDNPQVGSDSRQFGALAPERLIGRVICRSSTQT